MSDKNDKYATSNIPYKRFGCCNINNQPEERSGNSPSFYDKSASAYKECYKTTADSFKKSSSEEKLLDDKYRK